MKYDSNDAIFKVREFLSEKEFCDKSDDKAYNDLAIAFEGIEKDDGGFPLDKLVLSLMNRGWFFINAKGFKIMEDALKVYAKCQRKNAEERIKWLKAWGNIMLDS